MNVDVLFHMNFFSLEGNNLLNILCPRSDLIRGVAFGERGLIRDDYCTCIIIRV
jgi:hypothetical protein